MALRPAKNEANLLVLVNQGDQRAFAELFNAYYKQLGEYVFKLTESIEITEEIVQDVFVKIWLKRENLLEINNFCNYLFILSKNQTLNQLRKKAADDVMKLEWIKESDAEVSVSDSTPSTQDYREMLDLVIEKLPPQQKKVYKLSREGHLKHSEIAKILNISPETVKKYIKLALRFIKSELSGEIDEVIVVILITELFF